MAQTRRTATLQLMGGRGAEYDIDVELHRPPPVYTRYFPSRRFLRRTKDSACVDVYAFKHSNRLCMTGLAPLHTVIADKKTIKAINFDTSKQGNRLDNKPGGKRKKGAHTLQANETIAIIECDDGSTYPVISPIRGFLLEVNERLVDQPSLAQTDPFGDGYVALLTVRHSEGATVTDHLMPESEYDALKVTPAKARADA